MSEPKSAEVNTKFVTHEEVEGLEESLRIDEEQLDYEWIRQPQLHIKCIRFLARSGMAVTRQKNKIKETTAALNLHYRKEGVPGVTKVTEEAIKAAVALNKDLQELEEELTRLVGVDDYVTGLVRVSEQRVTALKWLSTFRGMSVGTKESESYAQTGAEFVKASIRATSSDFSESTHVE